MNLGVVLRHLIAYSVENVVIWWFFGDVCLCRQNDQNHVDVPPIPPKTYKTERSVTLHHSVVCLLCCYCRLGFSTLEQSDWLAASLMIVWTVYIHCVIHCSHKLYTVFRKKHPLTFSFISPWIMCGFKQKLQWIYLRNGRFWQCRNLIFIAADDVIMTSHL